MPRTSMSGTAIRPTASQRSSVGIARSTDPDVVAVGEAAVAPHPAAVVALQRVVEDAAPQRRLRAGGVELDGAGEQLVEVGEALGPVDEGDDGGGARSLDLGRDVDEHDAAHELGVLVGQRDRWSARRATCPRRRCASGASSPDHGGDVGGVAPHAEAALRPGRRSARGPGRSMATSGRPSAMATVSQVWAFWAPPWSSTSSGGASPHTSALEPAARGHLHVGPADDGRPVVGEAELLGVLVEQPELVVRDPIDHRRSLSEPTPANYVVSPMGITAPRLEGTVRVRDGRKLGIAEFGTPDGQPIVWLHGTPGARRQIPEEARKLADARGLRIIGIDRPGVGLSTAHQYEDIFDFVTDLEIVVDQLGIERFATIGLSGGAPVRDGGRRRAARPGAGGRCARRRGAERRP